MHENCVFYMLALSLSVVTFVAFIKVVLLVNLVILHHIFLTRKSFYDLVRFEILRCNHVLWFCTLIVLEAVSIVVLLLRRRHVYSVTVVVYLLEGRFCIESSPHSLRSFTFFIVQKLFSASYLFTPWWLLALPGICIWKWRLYGIHIMKVVAMGM